MLKIFDKNGCGLMTYELEKGELIGDFGPNTKKRIDELHMFKKRDDDVWICTWVKCGTHWIWEIANMLLNNTLVLDSRPKEDFMIEAQDISHFETLESPRILNTHLRPKFLPSAAKNSKILQMFRNPKDVAVSYFHHVSGLSEYDYSGTFDAFLDLYCNQALEWGSWFSYTKEWWEYIQEYPNNIFLTTYEDFHKNTFAEVKRLNKFLQAECSDDFCSKVVKATRFDKMRKDKNQNFQRDEGTRNNNVGEWKNGCDGGFYRKGKVGDWNNYFSRDQSENFDRLFQRELQGYSDLANMIKFEI